MRWLAVAAFTVWAGVAVAQRLAPDLNAKGFAEYKKGNLKKALALFEKARAGFRR